FTDGQESVPRGAEWNPPGLETIIFSFFRSKPRTHRSAEVTDELAATHVYSTGLHDGLSLLQEPQPGQFSFGGGTKSKPRTRQESRHLFVLHRQERERAAPHRR